VPARNRSSVLYYWEGKCHTLKKWSAILGISESTLYDRINRVGMSTDEAFSTPVLQDHGKLLDKLGDYSAQSRRLLIERRKRNLRRLIKHRQSAGLDTLLQEIDLYYLLRSSLPQTTLESLNPSP
jgi:hypothetical protein